MTMTKNLMDQFIEQEELWAFREKFVAWLTQGPTPSRYDYDWLRQKWQEYLDWIAGVGPEHT